MSPLRSFSHSPLHPSASLPAQIDSELHIFLFTRAREFKRSGLLVIAFPIGSGRSSTSSPSSFSAGDFEASRSKSHVDLTSADLSSDGHRRVRADSLQDHYTSPSPSPSRDVWQQVSRTLSTAVQRLVSIGSIKASIAHLLLEIPLWARSSAELGRTLAGEDVMKNWDVVESCGLGDDEGPLRVHHPAYRALMNGTMSRGPYVEHCVQFIKVSLGSTARLVSSWKAHSCAVSAGRLRVPPPQRSHESRRHVEMERGDDA